MYIYILKSIHIRVQVMNTMEMQHYRGYKVFDNACQ